MLTAESFTPFLEFDFIGADAPLLLGKTQEEVSLSCNMVWVMDLPRFDKNILCYYTAAMSTLLDVRLALPSPAL